MKIKKEIYNVIKRNKALRRMARKARTCAFFAGFWLSAPSADVNEKKVYFNTFGGRGYSDSPKALYEEMLMDDFFNDYEFVWSFFEPDKYRFLEQNKKTKVVKAGTREESRELRTSKYWISNYKMLDYQKPTKKQIYVQCWHGTPLKRLGFDIKKSDNAMNSVEEIREKYTTDAMRFSYLISPSSFATEKFITAWNLDKLKKRNVIIEEGYPRNDRLINSSEGDIRAIKQKIGIGQDNRKVILYAPTWRDNQHTSGVGYTYKTEVDFDILQNNLSDEYIILFRAHYLVANKFDFDKYSKFIYNVSEWDDINDLYLAADILITDYSSVMFDFSNLKRPIIFYMYDLEEYKDNLRGFYLSTDELPGPIVQDEEGLISAIHSCKDWNPDEKYSDFNKKYNYLDDGKVSKRVIDKIFKQM
ncbi:MAG: CDP-glycerol glycerophosphotransferase family protein [Candidatus Fimisoma sp.]